MRKKRKMSEATQSALLICLSCYAAAVLMFLHWLFIGY
nr:MAG TPA: hypothetical protein [Caudoviricetes sp.]